ncbi:MAG: N-acyl homoserine lactonase family protein [Chitinophagales bacterium]
MKYTIHPLYNGQFSIHFKSIYSVQNIHSFAFLIVDKCNDPVLVDTGFTPEYIPGPSTSFIQNPEHQLDNAICALGYHPYDIKTVVQTHLHWDHTAGMRLFPHARFYIQANEFRSLLRLYPNEETSFCPGHWQQLLDQVELIDGDFELKPGLRLVYTGGHTAGHQVVEVQTEAGKIILGGDVPYNYDMLWETIPGPLWDAFRQGPGARFYWDDSVLPDITRWLQTKNISEEPWTDKIEYKKITEQADRLILSHDRELIKTSKF